MVNDDQTDAVYKTIEICMETFEDIKKLTVSAVKIYRKMEKDIRNFEKAYRADEDNCARAQDLHGELDDASTPMRQLHELIKVDQKWTRESRELADEVFSCFSF